MSFDYNEIRAQQQASGTQWASYSDLFMVLAFIFLLLYMVSSLRTGMISLTSHAQIQEVKQELELYETVKDQYLTEQANEQEKRIYEEIIGQIALLEEEASAKKKRLAQESKDQEERESALNQYQQMIVAMMNANAVAKVEAAQEMSSQKQVNLELQESITQRSADLQELREQLRQEEVELAEMQKQFASASQQQQQEYETLSQRYEEDKIRVATLEQSIREQQREREDLKKAYAEKSQQLTRDYEALRAKHELGQTQLQGLAGEYGKNQARLEALNQELQQSTAEKLALEATLVSQTEEMQNKYEGLQEAYDANQGEVARLQSDLDGVQASLYQTTANLSKVETELDKKSKELQKAVKLAKSRQAVAQRIKDDFEAAGILAEVDTGTGDVILDFGKDYFETNSYQLKPGMRKTIRRAIPIYANSLFGQQSDTADISAIEIIGFASPTYGGKPVDPTELSAENRQAVNYNLDLSYERARSIFDYVFDTEQIQFEYQDNMLPLIKVTGRSFFTEEVNPGDTGNLTHDEFCKQYNCYASQRVIIKFGLTEKGTS